MNINSNTCGLQWLVKILICLISNAWYGTARLGSPRTVFLVFRTQKLWIVPGTFFWGICKCSKRAKLILNGGVKTLKTTDWSERIVT